MSSRFIKLAEFKIDEEKQVVISAVNSSKISIGQKLTFLNNGKVSEVFLKNALVLTDEGIDNLVECLLSAQKRLRKIQEVTGS